MGMQSRGWYDADDCNLRRKIDLRDSRMPDGCCKAGTDEQLVTKKQVEASYESARMRMLWYRQGNLQGTRRIGARVSRMVGVAKLDRKRCKKELRCHDARRGDAA